MSTAFALLTDWLEQEGFAVERGVAGVETAFRAIYHHGNGGPNIGLLCEYDALPEIGHACGTSFRGRPFWQRQRRSKIRRQTGIIQ